MIHLLNVLILLQVNPLIEEMINRVLSDTILVNVQ